MDKLERDVIENLSEPAKRLFWSLHHNSQRRVLKQAKEIAGQKVKKQKLKERIKSKSIQKKEIRKKNNKKGQAVFRQRNGMLPFLMYVRQHIFLNPFMRQRKL